jgi:hypothetical protein
MASPVTMNLDKADVTDDPVGTDDTTTGSQDRSTLIAIVSTASMIYLAGLIYYAAHRPIDGDEGFYTTAARLVWEGKTPYKDFFYQQAPLLPYLYSWVWAIHPHSLVAMRMVSAACGALAVFLWGIGLASARRLPTNVVLATFGAVLLNPYWVSWNVVFKTFAVANLLMSAATICLCVALHSGKLRWYFAGGLALGACVSVRSLYGMLIPAVLLWMVYHDWRRSDSSPVKTPALLAGQLCGLSPMIWSFLRDPRAFIFNNIQYHHLDAGYMWLNQRIIEGYQSVSHTLIVYFATIVVRLIGFHPYFAIELVLSIIGGASLIHLWKRKQGPYSDQDYLYFQLATLMFVVYTAVALTPFPPYDQYFDSPLVPFLIPFVAEGLRVTFRSGRKWALILAVVAPMLFAFEIGKETARNSWDPVWQLSCYREVTKVVEDNTSPDDVVLSFWPGFVFESGRQYFPGLEDHFVYRIMNKISPQERARYHVISKEQIMSAIGNGTVNVLVIPPWIIEYYQNLSPTEIQSFHATVDANYRLVGQIRDIAVYRRRAPSTKSTIPALTLPGGGAL